MTGEFKGVVPLQVADHNVEEVFSEKRRGSVIRYRLLSPLYNSANQVGGVLACFRIVSTYLVPQDN
jgi:hypothetical protein